MIIRSSSVVAALLALTLLVPAAAAPAANTLMVKAPPVKLEAVASSMPIWFEPNRGQVGGRTEWTSRVPGAWLFLTSNEVVYALPPEIKFDPKRTRGVPSFKTTNVHMRMVGGRRVKGAGEGALASYSNYFVGKHEDEWFTGVPHFERVRYPEVYPGIDLVYYATGRSVEYDFLLEPGADPSSIELAFDGAEGVRVDKDGDLVVSAGGKSFRQHRPQVFQGSQDIDASYRMTERGTVKLDIGEFDPLISVRVDPVLDFATYLGGPGADTLTGSTIAPDGNLVLVGGTQSPQSPTLDPFQQPSIVSMAPILLKMAADGRRVLYYAILGRGGWDVGFGVSVDKEARVLLCGSTRSSNFPLRSEFQSELKAIWDNGFVTRLSADGRSILHSSYLGGSNTENLQGAVVDEQGNGFVVGGSQSNDFPLMKPIQDRFAGSIDGVVAKIGLDGRLLFSTYFGGGGGDVFWTVALANDHTLIVGGASTYDGFPLKNPLFTQPTARIGSDNAVLVAFDLDPIGVRYSTYLGNRVAALALGLTIDDGGRIYVTGIARERGFPLKNPIFSEFIEGTSNGFLIALRSDGKEILFSTVIPGVEGRSISIDSVGNIYLGGSAHTGFPSKNAIQEFKGGGVTGSDHCILKIAPNGASLVYATSIGGTGLESRVTVLPSRNGGVFFVGQTGSLDYPVRDAYQSESGGSTDGIFGRMSDPNAPAPQPFQISPSSFSIRIVQGDPPPPGLRFSISGLTQAVTLQSAVTWLRITPSSLVANGNIQIDVDPSRLGPGIHRGVVIIRGASGVSTEVDVVLTLLGAAPILSAVEPARISIGAPDTEVTLRGFGFSTRTTVIVEGTNWQSSPVRFVDASTLRFTIPKSYFSGEYNFAISVQNQDSAVSKAVSLTVGRPAPSIAAGGIVNAASFVGTVISPGEIVTVFGENFEPGMRVFFDGVPSDPLYITPGQLSATVPYGLAGARETVVIVQQSLERRSTPLRIPVWPARPGLFTANSSGKGPGAILNQDGSINSAGNPAALGSVVVLYGTGGGAVSGTLLELPVKVFIDGIECEVLYAGIAPGLVSGTIQVNARVPDEASMGEVVLRVGERESQEGVTVALR